MVVARRAGKVSRSRIITPSIVQVPFVLVVLLLRVFPLFSHVVPQRYTREAPIGPRLQTVRRWWKSVFRGQTTPPPPKAGVGGRSPTAHVHVPNVLLQKRGGGPPQTKKMRRRPSRRPHPHPHTRWKVTPLPSMTVCLDLIPTLFSPPKKKRKEIPRFPTCDRLRWPSPFLLPRERLRRWMLPWRPLGGHHPHHRRAPPVRTAGTNRRTPPRAVRGEEVV